MNRTSLPATTALLLSMLGCLGALADPERPFNVLFIMADDLGWSDTTLYGTTDFYETPHIQRLAKRGLLLTHAYAANPLCSPTRSSILTGLYPARLGVTKPQWIHPFKARLAKTGPAHRRCLEVESARTFPSDHATVAQVINKAGYVCGHFGVWHAGGEGLSALDRGFDIDVPHHLGGAPKRDFLAPWVFLGEERTLRGKPGEHLEDRMAQEAVAFMKANQDKPFFLNYWSYSVHSPWTAKPELVEKYKRKVKPLSHQVNPVYAAMVESFDQAVGTLVQAVDDLGLANNTIIIFFSDNGGNTWPPPVTSPPGSEHIPGTHNFPLREGKGSIYEAGTRVPCIFVWPGQIPAGATTDALFSSVDFFPTLLEMLKIDMPANLSLDGINQVPTLLGQKATRQSAFCYHPHYTGTVPGAWVQKDHWKLLRLFCDNPDQTDRYELYHLKHDISEAHNLATRFPDKVKALNQLLDQYLSDTHAIIPTPNPAYKR